MTDPLRAKAEAIADHLFNRCDKVFLVIVGNDGKKCSNGHLGAYSFSEVVDRIHKHLLEMEEERKA